MGNLHANYTLREQATGLSLPLELAEERLRAWASNSIAFHALLLEVYGAHYSSAAAELQARLIAGSLGLEVEVIEGQILGSAAAGYTSSAPNGGERIYLNASWLASASVNQIEAVLLEELGHAIDHHLTPGSDTTGDEGERFSALLRGTTPAATARTELDQRQITINRVTTEIEASTSNKSLHFDGVDDCVEIADDPSLDFGGSFTLEAWIKPLGPGLPNGGGIIFNKENDYEIARFEDGTIRFAITRYAYGDWWGWVNTDYVAPQNAWTHVALTFNSNVATVYINGGAANGNPQFSFTAPWEDRIPAGDNTNPLRIGARRDPYNLNPSWQHFDGQISNARAWNVAQSSAAIAQNYKLATPLDSTGLVGSWALREGSGTTAFDSSPNVNNGTLVGFSNNTNPTWVEDLPFPPAFTYVGDSLFANTNVGSWSYPTFADIDDDGDLDCFTGIYTGETLFFQNTGTTAAAVFSPATTNPFGIVDVDKVDNRIGISSPAFADIDADGDLDLFIGNYTGETRYLENTGTKAAPTFADRSNNPFGISDPGGYSSPFFADIDSDGDLDLLSGSGSGDFRYQENTGNATTPLFAAPETNPFGLTKGDAYASPELVDIDGDGDLDLFSGSAYQGIRFFQNTGTETTPVFEARDARHLGLIGRRANNIGTADIDNDGDLDAFIGALDGGIWFHENINTGGGGGGSSNNPPSTADKTIPVPNTTTYQFVLGDFSFSDADAGDSLKAIEIQAAPISGTLRLSGTALAGPFPTTITASQISNLTYQPAAGSIGQFGFDFKVVDQSNAESTAETITMDVAPGSEILFFANGGGATKDFNSTLSGNQFRLLFTPDGSTAGTTIYKLNASNPPNSTLALAFDGSLAGDLVINIPSGFQLSNAPNSIELWDDYSSADGPSGNKVTLTPNGSTIKITGQQLTIADSLISNSGRDPLTYAKIRLVYAGVGSTGYTKVADTDGSQLQTTQQLQALGYTGYDAGRISGSIDDLTAYTFSAAIGATSIGSADIYNQNIFKRSKALGVLGFDNDSITGSGSPNVDWLEVDSGKVKVGLFNGSKKLVEVLTLDSDGWASSIYIHQGKQQMYTIGILDNTPSGSAGAFGIGDLVGGTTKNFAWGGNSSFITQTLNF